jgi:hypothetical protein
MAALQAVDQHMRNVPLDEGSGAAADA